MMLYGSMTLQDAVKVRFFVTVGEELQVEVALV
jgi:hypothetical protein